LALPLSAVLLTIGLEIKSEGNAASICPGPNLTYFSEGVSLPHMIDHIFGIVNIIRRHDRPYMFIKKLSIYVDCFGKQDMGNAKSSKQLKKLGMLRNNLNEGINYYCKKPANICGMTTML
jgi:hypothetical protein